MVTSINQCSGCPSSNASSNVGTSLRVTLLCSIVMGEGHQQILMIG